MYPKSDVLLLVDVFENLTKMCLKMYKLDSSKICFSCWISIASSLKKDRSRIRILTDIDMLLMVEKELRGGICHAIHHYAKAND